MNRDNNFSYIITFIAFIFMVLGLYAAFFADCNVLGWVPVREIPMRCLVALER